MCGLCICFFHINANLQKNKEVSKTEIKKWGAER